MIRLYLHDNIDAGVISLTRDQSHYLFNVMRKKSGEVIYIFNGMYGEWEAEIESKSALFVKKQIKKQYQMPIKRIAISVIKKLDIVIEKCTEIGITDIHLVLTDFANERYYNVNRLNKISIEATEQCGRLQPMTIHKATSLLELLQHEFTFAICDQHGSKVSPYFNMCPIIGPEGGFSSREQDLLNNFPKISLGAYTLRAETAAILAAGTFYNTLV